MNKQKLLLTGLVIIGFLLRIYGYDWDQIYLIHPDERHIVDVVTQLTLPESWAEFWDTSSPLNPAFFAYGSLPFYLLAVLGWLLNLREMHEFAHVGRIVSAAFDTGTIVIVFLSLRNLITPPSWLIYVGTFLYSVAVFPIQNAHFYTVDSQLTFWISLTLLLGTYAIQNNSFGYIIGATIASGLAVTTKISGIFLVVPIGMAFINYASINATKLIRIISFKNLLRIDIIILIFFITTGLTQPYMYLDVGQYVEDIVYQSRMSQFAGVFPYTIQYLGTTPYLYPFSQMGFWGLGVLLTILGILGLMRGLVYTARSFTNFKQDQVFMLLSSVFFLTFFGVLGLSAVKFMRYYLPVYPLLVIAAIWFIHTYLRPRLNHKMLHYLGGLLVLIALVRVSMFMSVYQSEHPMITATRWIHNTIPASSILAVEHWDRSLPLDQVAPYETITLELYQPDSPEKITRLVSQLDQTEYLILSSNRLYGSIPKWPTRYPATSYYYDLLFNNQLGFVLIKEFHVYPRLLHWQINDQKADESFTVYDHPRVLIFKNESFNASTAHQQLLSRID